LRLPFITCPGFAHSHNIPSPESDTDREVEKPLCFVRTPLLQTPTPPIKQRRYFADARLTRTRSQDRSAISSLAVKYTFWKSGYYPKQHSYRHLSPEALP
jgi:hypothetical protein